MAHTHPMAFLLGLEGHALLRAYAGEFGADFTAARLAEVRTILDAYERGEIGGGGEVGEIDTVTGYRDWSRRYDEPGNPLIDVDEPIVRRILATLPSGDALDVCCGTGRFAAILDGGGHKVTGVDSSPEMLDVARRKAPGSTFMIGDANALPVPDASTDLITCGLALTHLADLTPVFAEFARVLRPGGQVVTSDIHWQSLYLGGIASALDGDGREGRMPAARHRPSDYISAAVAAGFEVRECHEPRWPTGGGGDFLRSWAAAAVDAAYENTPAAIVWRFQLFAKQPRTIR